MMILGRSLANSHTLYYKKATMPAKKPKDQRKDKIIQTRVNEALDDRLRQEAKQRRLPVSQLIRNLLEDSFALVGNVVDNVDAIAQDAIGLGKQAGVDAQHLARRASKAVVPVVEEAVERAGTDATRESSDASTSPPPTLESIVAWQGVVLNAEQTCSACSTKLLKGRDGFLGLSSTPGQMAWLCQDCRAGL
jgi:hypothetical protein